MVGIRVSSVIFWLLSLWGVRGVYAETEPVLTTAAEVRALTPEETREERSVRVRGTVTYSPGRLGGFAMQDDTGGIFVTCGPEVTSRVKIGQEVEVQGVTGMETPTPRVHLLRMTPGEMKGLPAARQMTAAEILADQSDGMLVEVTGVIRKALIQDSLTPPRLALSFGSREKELSVWLARFDDTALSRLVPDTQVRLRGVFISWKSASFQSFSSLVVVHDPSQIEVLSPAPRGLEILPEIPLPELFASREEEFQERRRRVSGVVTLHWPGKLVVLQNEMGAIRLLPHDAVSLKLGDYVDAAGFVSRKLGGLVMEGAIFGEPAFHGLPKAEPVLRTQVVREAWKIDRDAHYLRLEGELKDAWSRDGEHVFSILTEGGVFKARLPDVESIPSNLHPGAHVELNGVCKMLFGEKARQLGRTADGFEIQLPDIRSISIVTAPGWWTPRRFSLVLAFVLAVLGVVLLWVMTLRGQVRRRSELLVREVRAHHDERLIADERSRLAADLHDALSQTLTGVSYQLEVSRKIAVDHGGEAGHHLTLARRLLDRSREDLRQAVWDLTPSELLERGLPQALDHLARELAQEMRCEISTNVEGDASAVPDRIRAHLFRIGQEAIHNALRHALPRSIRISLTVGKESILLEVADDGGGFDVSTAPGPDEGHFGLRSLRERVRRLGGVLAVTSSSEGTLVSVRIPVVSSA